MEEAPPPYLLKLLAAGSSLSIQAHPTRAQAREGFAREEAAGAADAAERLYRDDNHKPEIIVALSDEFHALVGVRDLATTRRLLAALGDGPALAHLDGLLAGPTPRAPCAEPSSGRSPRPPRPTSPS
ncbi:MAG: type I phosphomannose isomerase catalytic subunit [Microbacterium sp.]